MIGLVLLLGTVPAAHGRDLPSYLNQARHFVSQELYPDALEQLELAVAAPSGDQSAEAWYLLAQVRFEVTDLPGARDAATKARALSTEPQELRQTAQFTKYLRDNFGFVRLRSKRATTAEIRVDLETTLLDPDLKRYVQRLQERLAKGALALPYLIGLPVGAYRINGQLVDVEADKETTADPRSDAPDPGPSVARSAPPRTAIPPELELGLGVGSWLGTNLGPAPLLQGSLGWSLGPVVAGPVIAFMPQPYQDNSGRGYVSPIGISAGGRIGVEIPGLAPLVLRPSLVARFGGVPGVGAGCVRTGGDDGPLVCEQGDLDRSIDIYTTALVGIVGAEVALLYRDRNRANWGVGLKLGGDLAVGSLPREANANAASGPLPFQIDNPGFTAPGLRATAVWSLAL